MLDHDENVDDEKPFYIDRAAQGKAACRKCKEKCNKGDLRIAKLAFNMFGPGKMKQWHHVECMFDVLLRQRLTTKRIEGPDDIGNWENLSAEDQATILKRLDEFENDLKKKHGDKYVPPKKIATPKATVAATSASATLSVDDLKNCKDNSFREFRKLCADIANENSYLEKTALVKDLFTKGRDGDGFKGNVAQWCRMLLPGTQKLIYNLQNKQLIKLFSRIFGTNVEEMMEHLEQGDVSETIQHFFELSNKIVPLKKSTLTMNEVEDFLKQLSNETTEDRQIFLLKQIVRKCTGNDLKTIIRLIKHDLRMNAGAKHILEGIHPDAYSVFQSTHDLDEVIKRVLGTEEKVKKSAILTKNITAKISLMTPVLPMLAEPCKTIEQAMKKCPHGMYSEIKYDGERVQLHKRGNEFKYFSRSLKPVVAHKVKHLKDFISLAFPHGRDLILDSEILMIDTETGKPLPFGTLGVHKQSEFEDANVCLFVFDCIYYNGEDLTQKPIRDRKRILKENMTEIRNHVMFSELKLITKPDELAAMIAHTLNEGLEGLVLKDINSIYEPGKRHWLKVKKDYLFDGAMADSADLVVLGAWFGTGKKGGMMSIFLMGCHDPSRDIWCTVTKVHTGHDDATLERLQTELDMVKISCDPNKVPKWLDVNRAMVPDFVARDPKKQPVWEITGAEFTQQGVHTADKISVRFPRVTKIRDDKDWKTATSLPELRELFKKSKEKLDEDLLNKLGQYCSGDFDISKIGVPDFDEVKKESMSPSKIKKELKSEDENSPKKRKIKVDIKEEYSGSDSEYNTSSSSTKSPVKIKKEKTSKRNRSDGSEKLFSEPLKIKAEIKEEYSGSDSEYNTSSSSTKSPVKLKKEKTSKRNRSDGSEELFSEPFKIIKREKIEFKIEPSRPFPDIFNDIQLRVPRKLLKENNDLVRYFVAYGGNLSDENSAKYILHVTNEVSKLSRKYSPDAVHVTEQWLKKSILEKQVVDPCLFPVTLNCDS